VISPGTGLDCPRHRTRTFTPSRSLASASGGQDHTISPSALMVLVLHRLRVHRIPASRVVTIAIRHLSSRRDGATRSQGSEKQKQNIFRGRAGQWNQLGIALRTFIFRACFFFRRPPRIRGQTIKFAHGSLPDGQINACKRKTPVAACRRAPPMARLRLIAGVRDRLGSEKARAEVDPIAQQHEREQQAGAAEDDDGAERFDIDLETGRARKHSGKGGHCSLQQNPENSV
jgi:hypothetical protein